jgi:hypothetical protein
MRCCTSVRFVTCIADVMLVTIKGWCQGDMGELSCHVRPVMSCSFHSNRWGMKSSLRMNVDADLSLVFCVTHPKNKACLCRDTKADLSLIGPPTPQQVIGSAASNIEKSLHKVDIGVAKYFAPVASKILEKGVGEALTPVQILAVTMAHMSGYTDLPKEKSILGQQEGFVTLGINTPGGNGLLSHSSLLGTIKRVTNSQVAGSVGSVEIFEDPEDAGFDAAFDLPKKYVDDVLSATIENGVLHVLRSVLFLSKRETSSAIFLPFCFHGSHRTNPLHSLQNPYNKSNIASIDITTVTWLMLTDHLRNPPRNGHAAEAK